MRMHPLASHEQTPRSEHLPKLQLYQREMTEVKLGRGLYQCTYMLVHVVVRLDNYNRPRDGQNSIRQNKVAHPNCYSTCTSKSVHTLAHGKGSPRNSEIHEVWVVQYVVWMLCAVQLLNRTMGHFSVVHCCMYSNTDFLILSKLSHGLLLEDYMCIYSRLSTVMYMHVTDALFSLQTLLWGRSSVASNWQRANTKPLSLPSGTTTGTKCISVSEGLCVNTSSHHISGWCQLIGEDDKWTHDCECMYYTCMCSSSHWDTVTSA